MFEYLTAFLTGGVGYIGLELVFRGWTHWTMFLAGGFSFLLVHVLCTRFSLPLFVRCIGGSFLITAVEFVIGLIVNVRLGWAVWDYSELKFNILGQICLIYSCAWGALCIPLSFLSKYIHTKFLYGARQSCSPANIEAEAEL